MTLIKITFLTLAALALFASAHVRCMEKAIGLKSFPPAYQLIANEHTASAQPLAAAMASTEQSGSNPVLDSLRRQQRLSPRLRSLLSTKQTIVDAQQEIFKHHELIGTADTATQIELSIALIGLMNYFIDVVQIMQSDTPDVIYPVLGASANLVATVGTIAAAINNCSKQAHLKQQLDMLLGALDALDTEPTADITQKRTELYKVHEKIGSNNTLATGLFIGGMTLSALNIGKNMLILLLADGKIPLTAECINAGIAAIAVGLTFKTLVLHARNQRLAKTLKSQLDQLILNEHEQEEV